MLVETIDIKATNKWLTKMSVEEVINDLFGFSALDFQGRARLHRSKKAS